MVLLPDPGDVGICLPRVRADEQAVTDQRPAPRTGGPGVFTPVSQSPVRQRQEESHSGAQVKKNR